MRHKRKFEPYSQDAVPETGGDYPKTAYFSGGSGVLPYARAHVVIAYQDDAQRVPGPLGQAAEIQLLFRLRPLNKILPYRQVGPDRVVDAFFNFGPFEGGEVAGETVIALGFSPLYMRAERPAAAQQHGNRAIQQVFRGVHPWF